MAAVRHLDDREDPADGTTCRRGHGPESYQNGGDGSRAGKRVVRVDVVEIYDR
jgi:hypothetical protein